MTGQQFLYNMRHSIPYIVDITQERKEMEKKQKGHLIERVLPGSIAEEMEIEAGDRLEAVNGQEIEDIFDYQYLTEDEELEVLIRKADGEEWLLDIEKDPDEDLGLVFPSGLMDEYRSCSNRCIFCFIDQMPRGMRKTLYFKDDDARLSFLQGNYITLTNLSEHDIERIIRYRLSPVNISVHTTDKALRCKMLHNDRAGEALEILDRFFEAGLTMNAQIVLCKGVNDGEQLKKTIEDLSRYMPCLESLSVVPVGLTKYREKLFPLEPFGKEDAREVLSLIHSLQDKLYPQYENHFVHPSDEWYLLAEEPIPEADCYDGYPQLENGVGMVRLLTDEVEEALQDPETVKGAHKERRISIATGLLAAPVIRELSEKIMEQFPGLKVTVHGIENRFFGPGVTVSGLLTGGDILEQLKDKELGEALYLPQNVLRSGEEVFLDDLTLTGLADSLQVPVHIVESSGYDLVRKLAGEDE